LLTTCGECRAEIGVKGVGEGLRMGSCSCELQTSGSPLDPRALSQGSTRKASSRACIESTGASALSPQSKATMRLTIVCADSDRRNRLAGGFGPALCVGKRLGRRDTLVNALTHKCTHTHTHEIAARPCLGQRASHHQLRGNHKPRAVPYLIQEWHSWAANEGAELSPRHVLQRTLGMRLPPRRPTHTPALACHMHLHTLSRAHTMRAGWRDAGGPGQQLETGKVVP